MKKLSVLLMAAALFTLPLAACGSNTNEAENEDTMPEETPRTELPSPEPVPEEPEEPEETLPAVAMYVSVKTGGLNVRSGAGTSYSSLGQVEKGVLLHLEEREGEWYKTAYKNRTAYVSANPAYTSVTTLEVGNERVERVIEEGLKVLGTPYVYGATRLHDGTGSKLKGFSTAKFDCSSLMQYIFYEGAGVLLDVNTRTQIKQGVKVEKSALRRGDLMFFTNASRYYNTGIERVGHVALYLGENYILHTASDYAKIEQISTQRWNYFLEARRVL